MTLTSVDMAIGSVTVIKIVKLLSAVFFYKNQGDIEISISMVLILPFHT